MNQEPRNLPLPDDLRELARELRSGQTDAEQLVWSLLRGRRFLKLKFRRQHPIKPYVLDFYCQSLRWAIELDGGQHNTNDGKLADKRRTEFLGEQGIVVTRFWNHHVLAEFDAVVEVLFRRAKQLGA